ncbi:MAG TPA: HAD hydrolase family protein [Acidobacteriota bacterium]|nr:HAD hydrolase family protein [Acidobacteriota bacterium]
MHLGILACDLDGTLTLEHDVPARTFEVLRRAKEHGLVIILVTGRIIHSFNEQVPFFEICEAVVAEDGAVVFFPRTRSIARPFGRLNRRLVRRIEKLDIPMEKGSAIIATREPHDQAILAVLKDAGGGATVEYNRGAVMVLPPGATKGTGLLYALRELGYSPRSVLACGDAENDRSLFEMSEMAVAVANAAPDIQRLADSVLERPNGAGVEELIQGLIQGRLPPRRVRPDKRIILGSKGDDSPVFIDPFRFLDDNLAVVGASACGKSWLAGLIAEEILKEQYQVCIIDPEGDYRSLKAFRHTLLLGGAETTLPPVVSVITLLEYSSVSLVLDLSAYSEAERRSYVLDFLSSLRALRASRKRPHWILIDEAQGFFPPEEDEAASILTDTMKQGGVTLVTYKPSCVSKKVLGRVHNWVLTRCNGGRELQTLVESLPRLDDSMLATIKSLPLGEAVICFACGKREGPPIQETIRFRTAPRDVPHIRHLHKYLQVPLPTEKRFYFSDAAGGSHGSAASLWELTNMLPKVPARSLEFHSSRGDLVLWVEEVLQDEELGRHLKKLKSRGLLGETLRDALIQTVRARYEELESLI